MDRQDCVYMETMDLSTIPFEDARNMAEAGFTKLASAAERQRTQDGTHQSIEEEEDKGLAEISKAYRLAKGRVLRKESLIDKHESAIDCQWLTDLFLNVAAKFNECAMSGLNRTESSQVKTGEDFSDPANSPQVDMTSSSSLSCTLPSFQASGSPSSFINTASTSGKNSANTLIPSSTRSDFSMSRKMSRSIKRRMKMLGRVIEMTRTGDTGSILSDSNRLQVQATTFNNLAIVHRQSSRPHMALRCLVRVAELESMITDADHATTHLNMAAVLSSLKRHRDALGHANIAIRLLSDRLETLQTGIQKAKDKEPDKAAADEITKTRSLLAIAHYNLAVEREHLKHRSSSLTSYRTALKVAKDQLGDGHPVVTSIASSIANCSIGNVNGYKLPRPPRSPRSHLSRLSPRNLKSLGLGKDSPSSDQSPERRSPMAGVKRIKRYGSLAEEIVSVFKEAMDSKRVVHGDVLETVEDIFMAIDQDGGGTVSIKEFKVGLDRLSITLSTKSLEELVKSIDTDGDGSINFPEFVAYMNRKFEHRKRVMHSKGIASRHVVSKDSQKRKERERKLAALRKASPVTTSTKAVTDNGEEGGLKRKGKNEDPGVNSDALKSISYSDLSEQEIKNALHGLFIEFDLDGSGHIEMDELKKMLQDLPSRVDMKNEIEFSNDDAARILEAFDEDGNGEVEEAEWVQWIRDGLNRSEEDRQSFAEMSPLAGKLTAFLNAVEKLIVSFPHKA